LMIHTKLKIMDGDDKRLSSTSRVAKKRFQIAALRMLWGVTCNS